jgi:hypothetical protein
VVPASAVPGKKSDIPTAEFDCRQAVTPSPTGNGANGDSWCSQCFTDWRESGATLYSPLIWHLSSVYSCPTHQKRRLADVCPHCQKQHFPLSRWSLPGHCPKCGSWLGAPLGTAPEASPTEVALATEASGFLEAVLSRSCSPSPAVFSMNLRFLQDQLYGGSLSGFAGGAGLGDSGMRALVTGQSKPGLGTVLRISVMTQVPARKIVAQILEESDLSIGRMRLPIRFPRRKFRSYKWDQVRKILLEAATAERPRSLHSLCEEAGWDPGRVSRALPKEARALIQRTLAVRSTLKQERLQQAKLDIHRAVSRCFEEKKRLCHATLERLMKKPGSFRSPELRACRDQLVQLAQRGELPKVEG